MAYTPYTWQNGEDGGTPITAAQLNHIENGIADNASAIALVKESTTYSSVPTSYDNSYLVRYDGKQIGPVNFVNTSFIIFVQSRAGTNRAEIYSVVIGADSSACSLELLAGSNPAHNLAFTSGGNLYIKSVTSAPVTADVTVIKTR